jgi:hypothetical protein
MTCSRLFRPHENLSDEVNRELVQSEIEGGVRLQDLEPGSMLKVHTQNTCYEIVVLHDGLAYLSGHPLYCPQPVLVTIAGSTWGGSMLKVRFIGQGMHLEFRHPGYLTPIVTSIIREIRECRRTVAALALVGLFSVEECKRCDKACRSSASPPTLLRSS